MEITPAGKEIGRGGGGNKDNKHDGHVVSTVPPAHSLLTTSEDARQWRTTEDNGREA